MKLVTEDRPFQTDKNYPCPKNIQKIHRMTTTSCEICGEEFTTAFDENVCRECTEYFETLQELKPKLERLIELLDNHGPLQLHDCLGWTNQELELWEE